MFYVGVRTSFQVVAQSLPRNSYAELQYFRENPFFSDAVLRKEYRYAPLKGIDDEKRDDWNVTDAQAAFSWDVNVEPKVPEHDSTYLYQSSFTFFHCLGY